MSSSSKRVFFDGKTFDVWKNVYEPAEDSFLFAENLKHIKGDVVLDMGTGCGFLGILAAENASTVVATDLNPDAVHCAQHNARLNGVEKKLRFIQGNLFSPLASTGRFDLILFNAPYLPADETEGYSWLNHAWSGGPNGRQVIDRFIHEVKEHLAPNGMVLLMQSTLSNVPQTIRRFEEMSLRVRKVAEQDLPFFETITLIEGKSTSQDPCVA